MRNYIDPTIYMFGEIEWKSYIFVPRLEGLLNFLEELSVFESKANLKYFAFRFRASDELVEAVYRLNPFMNIPELPNFYQRQFRSSILPELLRRVDYCPTDPCLGGGGEAEGVPLVQAGASDIMYRFAADLGLCAACNDASPTNLITHLEAEQSLIHNGYFDFVRRLPADVLAIGDAQSVFPWEHSSDQDERVRLAISIRLAQLVDLDPSWKAHSCGRAGFSDAFWKNLRNAEFRGNDNIYRRRILDVLTQIICARDVDIHEHRMVGETISAVGGTHGKWNAYVFQSGATAQDRRCSRIYFAKIKNGVYIEEFNPDVH